MIEAILKLPAPVRHVILLALSVVIGYVGTDVVPDLSDRSPVVGVLAGALVTAVLAIVTPLVSSYGVGAGTARALGARTPADNT
jgi:hypothetical protein